MTEMRAWTLNTNLIKDSREVRATLNIIMKAKLWMWNRLYPWTNI